MLRDQHHDLSLVGFRDFAASKKPDEKYMFLNRETCACAQYAKHIGLYDEWMKAELGGACMNNSMWSRLNNIAGADDALDPPADEKYTWGALRDRLEHAVA